MNDLRAYEHVFDRITPWRGEVPAGYFVDFLGTLTDARFRRYYADLTQASETRYVETSLPNLDTWGEAWFEAVNWIQAATEAGDDYVMITLGACYGAQALGAYKTWRQLRDGPIKLVAVEPEPGNYEWLMQHFADNDIDPRAHWLLNVAVGASTDPVLFPIGATGVGGNNCVESNESVGRRAILGAIRAARLEKRVLESLMLSNSTGYDRSPGGRGDHHVQDAFVSALGLVDILAPLDHVDYLEADLQQSELDVFPPCLDVLRAKVGRIHLGTHGIEIHEYLHKLFDRRGWEIVFSYEPDSRFETELGEFETTDGVLTVRNPGYVSSSPHYS